MSKPKVGFYWCASCGGCEEAVVDLAEAILDVVEAVEIVFWPCAMDFKRRDEILIDAEKCFLAQGLICMGPATRCGCDHACIEGNMPCTGCLGPVSRVRDQGAAGLSAIASLVASKDMRMKWPR